MTQLNHFDIDGMTYSYSGPFKKGLNVASHYGFSINKPLRVRSDIKSAFGNRQKFHKDCYVDPVQKILIHEEIEDKKLLINNPVLGCHTYNPKKKVGGGINLYVIGSKKAIAEAMVIKATMAMLREYGKKDLILDINSLGDKNSYKTFLRDFTNHYRRNINVIGNCCRTNMKEDISLVAECKGENCKKIRHDAPRSVSYLSESDRKHFKDVLEYIEAMDIPYRINCDLIGESPNFGTRTAFLIRDITNKKEVDDGVVVAKGERYGRTLQNNQNRRVPSTVFASVDLLGGKPEKYVKIKSRKRSPNFFLIHLGIDAKRKSLDLLDFLRKENFIVAQSLVVDGLSEQIQRAERMSVPYTIIMGLKEVKEESVIIRNVTTRAQETVPFVHLVKYLKKVHRL